MNQRGSVPLILIIGIIVALSAIGGAIVLYNQSKPPAQPPAPATSPEPSATTSSTNSPSLGSLPKASSSPAPLTLDFITQAKLLEDNIKLSPKLLDTKKLADGSTQYFLQSFLIGRSDTAIFKDNKLVYQRTLTVSTNLTHPRISDYLAKLGPPDKILTGSKYYGPFEKIYVFALKGTAFTGNPNTNEIDELQIFQPTTLDDYLKNWAIDYQVQPDTITDNF